MKNGHGNDKYLLLIKLISRLRSLTDNKDIVYSYILPAVKLINLHLGVKNLYGSVIVRSILFN